MFLDRVKTKTVFGRRDRLDVNPNLTVNPQPDRWTVGVWSLWEEVSRRTTYEGVRNPESPYRETPWKD